MNQISITDLGGWRLRKGLAVYQYGLALLVVSAALSTGAKAVAAGKPLGCEFSDKMLSFKGSELEQAKCLLRPVKKSGNLGAPLATLPEPLESLIGSPAKIDLPRFKSYLETLAIPQDALGGNLDAPLSRAQGSGHPAARYFVIHDVSYNVCVDVGELARSDKPDAAWNLAARWANNKQAHLFITRDGKLVSPQGRTFGTPHRATKLEMSDDDTKGLFLHVENVQLRTAELEKGQPARLKPTKKNKVGDCVNDRIAQVPGFSDVQLSRLALVYVAASHRAGSWLIPAYHATIDDGMSDGHDDPQNFDLSKWSKYVCDHLTALGAACSR
ncbi:hypothetical protein GNX71_28460 [Variovorax sp. RKNM96]|uniref:hypothetical protein n=1 Tax=Variovorax sp. RKNM96 TaxID=2681552 RepID=UPI00197F0B5D|nr:hypothetical protein [Variovorax sp. RKNM96]QSI33288.1 hypothetical protein GNX71_28460 [Variovorax sp. RKNM96]